MPASEFTPFDPDGGLILAVRLPGAPADFDARRSWGDLAPPADPPPLWIHLDRTRDRAKAWLRTEAGLDPIVAEALLAEETRPRVQSVGDGLLVFLRGVNLNPGAEPDELITIRLWLEPTRIITLRQHRFQTIADIRARAQRGEAPATAGAFLTAVGVGLAGRLGPSVTNLEEMLDDIEDSMLDRDADDAGTRTRLATIRRQAITYRRFLVPQRDAMLAIITGHAALLDAHDQANLRGGAETIARAVDALEEIRDRAAVTSEEIRARHEARMGRTLYLLTIVATVALPLGLVTGLLGINVGGIPLAESSAGFLVVCAGLVVIAIAELAVFKAMRWL